MSFPVSWTFPVHKKISDKEFGVQIMQMMIRGLRETGIKVDNAFACAAAPSGISPRTARMLYANDGAFNLDRNDILHLRRGRQFVARYVAAWHERRAEYWRRIAAEEEAAVNGQQLAFEEARKWRTTPTKPTMTDFEYSSAA